MKTEPVPTYRELGLTEQEYHRILEILGREPNLVELAMYSLLWSEHCGYKHSKATLRMLPSSGKRVLQGPGENAGIVDLGRGMALVFKIESHNHPSAIEPYQGAATGVGGILRDVLAMGARPIALLDSLRFGPLAGARTRYLFEHVVDGIGGYGNCVGVPTVGGEVVFEECYEGNPLVNAMCVGLARREHLARAVAKGEGNLVVLIGSKTGRDGIGGASILASQEFTEGAEEKRPSVQVGDPFMEKLLIEACLELQQRGLLVGLQDLGAAGLTSSLAEMAARGSSGIDLDVSRVPLREPGMDPWEIMVSESQERMIAVVEPGRLAQVQEVCSRWELPATPVGTVTGSELFRVFDAGELVGEVPAASLADAPEYHPEAHRPKDLDLLWEEDIAALEHPVDLGSTLLSMLGSANICSRGWVWRQYDHQVQTNTVGLPGGDAALIRIRETGQGIAVATDGNGRYCYLDPRRGAAIAVAEAARNVSATGAEPIGLTDGLNFGSPEKPEIFWQFQEAIGGIADACRELDVPVVGGNVSFYNESPGIAVYPTPIVGMVGLLEQAEKACPAGFQSDGDIVFLVGETFSELGGSEYLRVIHDRVSGRPPQVDWDRERAASRFVREAVGRGWLGSAHDLSDGGLAVALAESCILGGVGAKIQILPSSQAAVALFSESQARFLVSADPADVRAIRLLAEEIGVSVSNIGMVGGTDICAEGVFRIGLAHAAKTYEGALDRWMSS